VRHNENRRGQTAPLLEVIPHHTRVLPIEAFRHCSVAPETRDERAWTARVGYRRRLWSRPIAHGRVEGPVVSRDDRLDPCACPMRSSVPRASGPERANASANKGLASKAKEMAERTKAVDEAEQRLAAVGAQLDARAAGTDEPQESEESDDGAFQQDLAELQARHEGEIQEVEAQHHFRLQSLSATFQNSIKEAEDWTAMRAENAKAQRMADLAALEEQFADARAVSVGSALSATREKLRFEQESKSTSIMNEQRITLLEVRISETGPIRGRSRARSARRPTSASHRSSPGSAGTRASSRRGRRTSPIGTSDTSCTSPSSSSSSRTRSGGSGKRSTPSRAKSSACSG